MTLASILGDFIVVLAIGLIAGGGVMTITARHLVNAVIGLALALFGVAGLYFQLGSPFLALMQVLIYVGAVCIMMVFGIMVGETPKQIAEKARGGRHLILAIGAVAAVAGVLAAALGRTEWRGALAKQGDFSLPWLGESLLNRFGLAFELISVVLLAAIVGAIIVARIGKDTNGPC